MARVKKLKPGFYNGCFSSGKEQFAINTVSDGFEFFYGGKWYAAKDGLVSPLMFTPAEQGEPSKKSK